LHPIWQRRLLDFLNKKLPNMQLVVSTHSPVTAQQSGPEALYVTKRRGGYVTLKPFGPDPGELLISQLLVSEAFGMATDESLKSVKRKKRLRTLKDKKTHTAKDKQEIYELNSQVEDNVSLAPSRSLLHEEQMAFLKRVEDEMGLKQK
jgi:hypothetical protein